MLPIIDESSIRLLVERFYSRVRADPLLAPVFAAVEDWDDHQGRLSDFWSSVMFATGRYKGDPVARHLRHAESMTHERFHRWLALWRLSAEEMLPPDAARAVQVRAERIAESLQLAVTRRRAPAP